MRYKKTMNKQIEIEDMAFDLCRIDTCKHLPQAECDKTTCAHCEAEALIKAGIRKTSAVAREFFAEIENCLSVYSESYHTLNIEQYSQLKKKYESEGEE